ncbi:UNVERIFIED_CONTAM: hypothetical protein Scaly_0164800 [Sesamum calycinum]|uniref:Uncharacterized protein n=1 Tax=Sesamum calycinum TaxID=2727403 RepID=A0AAW2SX59_9LAMI
MGCITRSLLLIILALALVNAQARTLTEDYEKLKAKYGRYLTPPPPPKSAPPTKQEPTLLLPSSNNYGRITPSPPPPKPASPVIQMISSWTVGSSEENNFSTPKFMGIGYYRHLPHQRWRHRSMNYLAKDWWCRSNHR